MLETVEEVLNKEPVELVSAADSISSLYCKVLVQAAHLYRQLDFHEEANRCCLNIVVFILLSFYICCICLHRVFMVAKIACRKRLSRDDPVMAEFLAYSASYYMHRAQFTECSVAVSEALTIRIGKLGKSHPQVATLYAMKGLVCRLTNDYPEAARWAALALEMRRSCYGSDHHPAIAAALHNQACIALECDDIETAKRLFNEALGIYQYVFSSLISSPPMTVDGDGEAEGVKSTNYALHTSVGHCLVGLSKCCRLEGQLSLAKKHVNDALYVYQTVFGEVIETDKHRFIALAKEALAMTLYDIGYQRKAIGLLKSCVDVIEYQLPVASLEKARETESPNHKDSPNPRDSPKDAPAPSKLHQTNIIRAPKAATESFCPTVRNVEVVGIKLSLAVVHISLYQNDLAKDCLLTASRILVYMYGCGVISNTNSDPSAPILMDLKGGVLISEFYLVWGQLCTSMALYSHAKELYSRSFGLKHRVFGGTHSSLAVVLSFAASNMVRPGYFVAVRVALEEAWGLLQNSSTVKSSSIDNCDLTRHSVVVMRLIYVQSLLDQYTGEAERAQRILQEQCIPMCYSQIEDTDIPNSHLSTLLNDIGECMRRTDNASGALKIYDKCLPLRVGIFGEKSIPTMETFNNQALALMHKGDVKDACKVWKDRVVPVFELQYGRKNLYYLNVFGNMGLCMNEVKAGTGQDMVDESVRCFECYNQCPLSADHPWVLKFGGYLDAFSKARISTTILDGALASWARPRFGDDDVSFGLPPPSTAPPKTAPKNKMGKKVEVDAMQELWSLIWAAQEADERDTQVRCNLMNNN